MKAKSIIILISLLAAGSLLTPTVVTAQSETPKLLSRLQAVEDPELGELIRVALENDSQHYNRSVDRELELTRKVTVAYAQIKLLDRQIELLEKKAQMKALPDELQYELILARAELEAKRTTELATLREIVWIMPNYPLKSKSTQRLKAWLALEVLDEHIRVCQGVRPFRSRASDTAYTPMGLMSKTEALAVVSKHLSKKDELPIRVDIYHNPHEEPLAAQLEREVIGLIRQAKAELQAEVHLEDSDRSQPGSRAYYLERNRIATSCSVSGSRVPKVRLDHFVEPNDIPGQTETHLLAPGNLPAIYDVRYDPSSRELSIQVAREIERTVEALGLAEYVTVRRTLQELDKERQYLGRWEAVHEGETFTIAITQDGRCRLTADEDTREGNWRTNGKQVGLSLGDETIWGHINAQGHLVLDEDSITFKRAD